MWQISYPLTNGASLGSYFASPEIFLVEFSSSQTDKFFDPKTGGMWICYQLKFLLPYSLRSQGDNCNKVFVIK